MLMCYGKMYSVCDTDGDIFANIGYYGDNCVNITHNIKVSCIIGSIEAIINDKKAVSRVHKISHHFYEWSLLQILQNALRNPYSSDVTAALEPINARYYYIVFNLREAGVIGDLRRVLIIALISLY